MFILGNLLPVSTLHYQANGRPSTAGLVRSQVEVEKNDVQRRSTDLAFRGKPARSMGLCPRRFAGRISRTEYPPAGSCAGPARTCLADATRWGAVLCNRRQLRRRD